MLCMQIRWALGARVPQALRRSPRGPRNPHRLGCPLVLVMRRSPLHKHTASSSPTSDPPAVVDASAASDAADALFVQRMSRRAASRAMISARFIRARVLCFPCLPRLRICFEAMLRADEGNYSEAPSLAAFCLCARAFRTRASRLSDGRSRNAPRLRLRMRNFARQTPPGRRRLARGRASNRLEHNIVSQPLIAVASTSSRITQTCNTSTCLYVWFEATKS